MTPVKCLTSAQKTFRVSHLNLPAYWVLYLASLHAVGYSASHYVFVVRLVSLVGLLSSLFIRFIGRICFRVVGGSALGANRLKCLMFSRVVGRWSFVAILLVFRVLFGFAARGVFGVIQSIRRTVSHFVGQCVSYAAQLVGHDSVFLGCNWALNSNCSIGRPSVLFVRRCDMCTMRLSRFGLVHHIGR